MQQIFDFLSDSGGNELALFIVSMIPLIELRGSVLLGAAIGMPWPEVLGISLVGNILPIPFVILFGEKVLNWAKTLPPFRRFANWYETRLLRKAQKKSMSKYSLLALCLFVAIPVPGTGAWSGALIATLLNMRVRDAFLAITLGVLIAGIIMTVGAYGLLGALRLAG